MTSYRTTASRPVTRLTLTALAALGGAPLAADAQATQITSAAGLATGDATLSYTITQYTFVSSYTGRAGGNTLTFTDAGETLYEAQQGGDLSGAFPNGTNVLATIDSNSKSTGPLTITFASGVTQFGLSAENVFPGSYYFTFTPFSGTNPLGTFLVGLVGVSDLAFLGAKVGSGSITSVQISTFCPIGHSNTFYVGPVTSGPAAAPEPSSVAALSLGVLGVGTLAFRARRRSAA